MVTVASGAFARPGVVRQGWYLVARSSRIRAGRVRAMEIGSRRLVVYRDLAGRAHVADDHCPHLGSDLALATVEERGLRCEFHGWCWGADGSCVEAPGNRIDLPRALAVLWSTALDDLKMMERIRWTGAFAPADAALERYAGFVEALPEW